MIPAISDPESLSTPGSNGEATSDDSNPFGVLEAPQRRAVLRYLVDTGESTVPVADLADHVTATLEDDDQADGRIAELGDALLGQRRRLQIALRHVHVPKLADAGAVDFDLDANTVTLREQGTELLARAEAADDRERSETYDDPIPEVSEASVH